MAAPTIALVTGGAGFIGGSLVHRLVTRGDQVRILDNFSTGSRETLAPYAGEIEVIEGDLRSYERVHTAMRGSDVVFHLGALPSVPRSIQDPLTTSAVNVEGTLNVLLAARDAGARRVVVASSSSVYGAAGESPRTEDSPTDPLSPYAVSKLAAEHYATSFSRVYALETVALRFFNVYGPRQDPSSEYAAVVPRFITALDAGRPVPVYGDGSQTRDFTYVDDVVDATLLAAEADGAASAVLNVATGRPTTVNALAEAGATVLDRALDRRELPPRSGEVHDSWADISRTARLLGYRPQVDLEEGLRRTADALRARSGLADPV